MAKSNLEKRWEEAGLTDDFVFSKVFLDPQITLELLRRIFPELVIKDIKVLNSQQEIKSTYDAKSVRFDIYIEDRDNNTTILKCRLQITIISPPTKPLLPI